MQTTVMTDIMGITQEDKLKTRMIEGKKGKKKTVLRGHQPDLTSQQPSVGM